MNTRGALLLLLVGCGQDHHGSGDPDASPSIDAPLADLDATPDAPPDATSSCTAAPATGSLDPACVYLQGTLTPGYVGSTVLIHTSYPADLRVGFGEVPINPAIRPDGRLLFADTADLDTTPIHAYLQVVEAMQGSTYPAMPLANDDLLSTPACEASVHSLRALPGGNAFMYECGHGYGTYYRSDNASAILEIGDDSLRALNPSGVAFVTSFNGGNPRLVDGTTSTPVVGLAGVVAARWDGTGFLVSTHAGDPPAYAASLSRVALDGTKTSLGDYQLDTATQTSFFLIQNCKLELGGAMWCIGSRFDADVDADDVVLRFTMTAPPSVEFDEAQQTVKIHGGGLVTGG